MIVSLTDQFYKVVSRFKRPKRFIGLYSNYRLYRQISDYDINPKTYVVAVKEPMIESYLTNLRISRFI